MDNYVILEEICQTQFSTILKCKNKKSKHIVVLKQIMQKKIEDSPSKEVLRELLILMNFKHPNIVTYHTVFVNKTNIVIEMEYCVIALSKMTSQISKPFHVAQIKKIMKSIAEGLKYLHENDIMHRDIKPGNIFIDENCNVKIGDFGSSRIINSSIKSVTPMVGTKWYKAPEIILGRKDYDKYVDIWSFGCLFAELYLLEPLFPGNTDFEMINYIFNFLGLSQEDKQIIQTNLEFNLQEKDEKIWEKTFDCADEEALDLLKKMLIVNYEKRITIDKILEHPFLIGEAKYNQVNLPI
jgi:cell division cycle 2-like protein